MLQPFMDMMLQKWGAAGEADEGENENDDPADDDDDAEEASAAAADPVHGAIEDGNNTDDDCVLLDPYNSCLSSPVPTPSPTPISDATSSVLPGSPARDPIVSSSDDKAAPAEVPKKEHVFECQLERKPAFTSLLTNVASPQKARPTTACADRLARLLELRWLCIIRFKICIFEIEGCQHIRFSVTGLVALIWQLFCTSLQNSLMVNTYKPI